MLTAGEFTVARKLENEQPAAGASSSTSSFSAAGRSRPCRPRADRIRSARRPLSVVDGRLPQVMLRSALPRTPPRATARSQPRHEGDCGRVSCMAAAERTCLVFNCLTVAVFSR